MRRLVPFPLVALGLLALWLLLARSLSPATFLMGGALALGGSWALLALTPPRVSLRRGMLRRWAAVPGLLALVSVEVVRSNNAVARIILQSRSSASRRAGFVQVPLDMRNPYGLAALACILTATPGTVWVDYDRRANTMLLHVLDLVDEAVWVGIIKNKWERPLMEIFE